MSQGTLFQVLQMYCLLLFLPDCPFKMSGAAQTHFGSCYAPKYANLFLKEDGFLKEAGSTFGLQS